MTTEVRPAHSPLGASGAERWMNCPGSVTLLKRMGMPESDETDYQREGSAAHEAAAYCLKNGLDAWEVVGEKFYGDVECDAKMADAIQVYLDTVRALEDTPVKEQVFVEYQISSPKHKDFYGTVDHAVINESILCVSDFKYGAGIAVDVEWNPQLMYYAYGLLQDFQGVRQVALRIIQPRAFHPDGSVRRWMIPAEDLCLWAEKELIPAMSATEIDHTLDPGPWCRFCPAKLICPMLTALFGAACTANPEVIVNMNDAALGRSYQYVQGVKMYLTALEKEVFKRLNDAHEVPGTKLVAKKANRVWKDGAATIFQARFGGDASTPPELKSPAEMEKISNEAKALVTEWAYTPKTGTTVALKDDKRPEVKVQKASEVFKGVVDQEAK